VKPKKARINKPPTGARFITSAAELSQCPKTKGEVAFIGRSNVGKSRLLGELLGASSLVRTSRTPGRTQLINFFANAHDDILVDLPGYGFATMPPASRRQLRALLESYLCERESLLGVFLLLDIRREQASEDDLYFISLCRERGLPLCLVITKIDKLNKSQRKPALEKIAASLQVTSEQLFPCSSLEGDGIASLRTQLAKFNSLGF